MKTKLVIGALILLAVASAAAYFLNTPPSTASYSGPTTSTATTTQSVDTGSTATTTATSYTLAQVALHKDATSCWTAINGKVYDVTSWINQHPGGPEAILSICGSDGSAAFNAQHGGQRRPESELANFYIGPLVP